MYGRFGAEVERDADVLAVDGHELAILHEPDPIRLPWSELDVDVLLECTGRFRTRDDAAKHLLAGAGKVVVSAPMKDPDVTVVLGVNFDEAYDPDRHDVISNASCTTNCLAPVAKVLHESVGIRHGLMTTIHAYTGDQRLVDLPHKDLRRARAAARQPDPDHDRRREGDRPGDSGARRQAARLRGARPGPDGLARRPDDRGKSGDLGGRAQRALPTRRARRGRGCRRPVRSRRRPASACPAPARATRRAAATGAPRSAPGSGRAPGPAAGRG